jgi:hypothetical protein
MKDINFLDEYEIKARYIPCFLPAVFPVHFCIQFLGEDFWQTIALNIGWMVAANVSLSLIITLALIQLQCGIAKHWIEESIFGKAGINFPTTAMLLFHDSFLSTSMKSAIHEKLVNDFKFELMSENQEQTDINEAKRRSREAVGFIRRSVGRGIMTYQYNIRYGFIRNFLGGAFWGLAGSISCACWYGIEKNWRASSFFIVCSICFLVLLLFRERVLKKYAYQYAETLLSEYMSITGENK